MLIRSHFVAAALGLAALSAVSVAHADTLVVNLAGWQSFGEFGETTNTQALFTLPAGSTVTGFSWTGLTFTTNGDSFFNEFVLSVNNFTGAPVTISEYLDWAPSTILAGGTFGPASGTWGGAAGAEGPFGAGGSFTVGAGSNNVLVTVYEAFDDPSGDAGTVLDATVSAGTLTITYNTAPIPEPSTYGLMALGLVGVVAAARRRRND